MGSELLGQAFDGPGWFHPRPGAFDPTACGSSNLGPTNSSLTELVGARASRLRLAGANDLLPVRCRSRRARAVSTRTSVPPTPGCRQIASPRLADSMRRRSWPRRCSDAGPHLRLPGRASRARAVAQPRTGATSLGDIMKRGHLRIYVGYAAGVGKTYAMLNEGHRRRARGTDVVIGYVEPHDRPVRSRRSATSSRPAAAVVYRDAAFEEMDVDAILRARPKWRSSTSWLTRTSPAPATRSAGTTWRNCLRPAST